MDDNIHNFTQILPKSRCPTGVHRRALTKHDDLVPPLNMPYFSRSKLLRRVGSDLTTSTSPSPRTLPTAFVAMATLVVASPWPLPHRRVATAAPSSSRRHSRSLNVASPKPLPRRCVATAAPSSSHRHHLSLSPGAACCAVCTGGSVLRSSCTRHTRGTVDYL